MTDFLDRLASSILGEAPSAQPLIAPRFAPGAEIFAPDTSMADDSHAAPYPTGYEQSPATIPSIAPRATAPMSIEERHPPDLQRSEQERPRIDQAPKAPQALAYEADFRKKPSQGPQRGPADAVPLAAFGIEHDVAPQVHPHDLETENLPASAGASRRESRSQKSASPPPIGPATSRPEVHQVSPSAAREQPVGVEPSDSRARAHLQITPVARETGKTLPPNEIHEVWAAPDSIRPERPSAQDPSNLESRRTGPDKMAIPSGDGPFRPVTRPPSLHAPDLLDVGWLDERRGRREARREDSRASAAAVAGGDSFSNRGWDSRRRSPGPRCFSWSKGRATGAHIGAPAC